ncbi:MAG: tetraacyldisaccharide 4'-kinase [Opitutales bacterium]|nr:tetraacyldisaccharide 4'-kinase [Opitutales bacterium]
MRFILDPVKEAFQRFELFTVDVIYGRRTGFWVAFYAAFLSALSLLFSAVARTRYWLYRNRILHDRPLGCLVVVVGNLTVGGTGKTPVVEKFARSLTQKGRKVAILTRGYKSKKIPLWQRWWRSFTHSHQEIPPRIVSDGEKVLLNSEEAGDEPYMLARNLPGVVVLVDRNRVNSGVYAIKRFQVDTLILDDGFQYLPLKGRLNLLLIDKTNPFGNQRLLPRGILREPVRHLKRASYVFVTKSDGRPHPEIDRAIEKYNPGVEVIECVHRPQYLENFHTQEKLPLTALQGGRVGAFSGIAAPDSFEGFLRRYGANLILTRRFLDHHRFTTRELEKMFAAFAKAKAKMIITTEKDAVRLPRDDSIPKNLYFLRLEIDILSGGKDFDKAVDRICFPGRL